MFTLLQFHELFSKDARSAGKFFYTPGSYFTSNFFENSNLVGGAAGSVTAAEAGTGNAVIEEVDDLVTVEDADAGEEIETIIVDESVDISVSGEDSSVPVTVVDESIPVDTVVEGDGKYSS